MMAVSRAAFAANKFADARLLTWQSSMVVVREPSIIEASLRNVYGG
jgi:poly-beta-hydroxyalkanoate depolymerase